MTNEEKQILMIDLCPRLPYGFTVHRYSDNCDITFGENELDEFSHFLEYSEGKEFKPYLRPMSSMTEEEKKKVHYFVESHKLGNCSRSGAISDYLNSIHIDYRGLIEMGLALEVPEGMYKTE